MTNKFGTRKTKHKR